MSETSAADSSLQGSRQAVTPLARASSGKTSARIAAWAVSILFPLTLYIVGFLVFFRWQIFSDFDLVFGDAGDARFVTFLHEHIYRWLYVRSGFLSPPFFFNQTRTLGYSDAFLLDQIIYAPLRLLGAEPLLAISLIAMDGANNQPVKTNHRCLRRLRLRRIMNCWIFSPRVLASA